MMRSSPFARVLVWLVTPWLIRGNKCQRVVIKSLGLVPCLVVNNAFNMRRNLAATEDGNAPGFVVLEVHQHRYAEFFGIHAS